MQQLLFSFILSVVWSSWNFVRFHEINFQTDDERFSFLSWKTKVLFLKKYFLGCCQYQNKKALFTDPIFSEGFVSAVLEKIHISGLKVKMSQLFKRCSLMTDSWQKDRKLSLRTIGSNSKIPPKFQSKKFVKCTDYWCLCLQQFDIFCK